MTVGELIKKLVMDGDEYETSDQRGIRVLKLMNLALRQGAIDLVDVEGGGIDVVDK
jgi:hypothetical protein